MTDAVARHFVNIGERVVHYRVAGTGPIALLIHQSPRSSAEYAGLMATLAKDYTVIAPDNPGNGLSTCLPEGRRTIEDYGDACADFLEAIGVRRTLLYGFHTGAAIGLAFASRHPERIAGAVLNGIPVPDVAKVDSHVERYLPPLVPVWDGGHLAWIWARLREQTIFYPWFSDDDTDRLKFTPPDGDALFGACLELLRPGDSYRHAYEAAFRVGTQALLTALRCPAIIVSAEWDPLYGEMEPLIAPEPVERVRLGRNPADIVPVIERAFASHAVSSDPFLPPPAAGDRGFIDGLHYRRRAGAGHTLVLLHDHHDDCSGAEIEAADAATARPTLAIDLPGHGESVAEWGSSGADVAARIDEALATLHVPNAHVQGFGLGATIAHEIEKRGHYPAHVHCRDSGISAEQHIKGKYLIENFAFPCEHAGRLLGAWRMARDGALFDPWCDPQPSAARRPAADLDPARVHRRAVAALKSMRSWQASWAALAPVA